MAVERPVRQLKVRSTPLSVAFSQQEREQVTDAAYLSEQSVSAFIRAAALKAAQRVAMRALKAAA